MGGVHLGEFEEAVADAAGDCGHYEPIPPVAPRGSVWSVSTLHQVPNWGFLTLMAVDSMALADTVRIHIHIPGCASSVLDLGTHIDSAEALMRVGAEVAIHLPLGQGRYRFLLV